MQSDLIMELQNNNLCLMGRQDRIFFTAAFDTIDHSILLTRLEQRFGISGKAWKWLASYLEDRTQFVSVNNLNSTTSTVKYGVPQGSVLGPCYFPYMLLLWRIFSKHMPLML